MKFMGANELRESFISFFESKEHLRMESFPLVPKNDNSLLLINAGMAPLKPYFTGIQKPPKTRVTTCQKCIRTGDIENVGKTSRHGTFFEMLGNFSFGDYFKNEIIPWSWEYVTQVLKLPKDKLYVTIYLEDDEAYEIWTTKTDIDPNRIFRLGKDDNFWEVGTVGPCGPCTEIHFDRGVDVAPVTNVDDFVAASDADRIVEFWNLVFIQFDKQEDGSYAPLKNKNIDTGMGLERIATIMQGVDNIFEIDTVKNILNKVSSLSGVEYGKDANSDVSLRIVTDHVKAVTMLISDGVQPSNEGRGYVLRRLLRRAARHGRLLGIKGLFLKDVVEAVVENYGGNYPILVENKDYITKIITLEEERFNETIDSGMNILNGYIKELEEAKSTVLSGEKAFKLYDTYGFPLELTEEILEEKNMTVDHEEFKKEMEAQRERARSARGETSYMGADENPINKVKAEVETEFVGYTTTEGTGKVVKNHTATHMLQAALKEVVGAHVHQAGSFVDNERLRFDFTHFQAMTAEEIQKVEDLVNDKIMEVDTVETKLMTIEEAKESGATALFDEKYGDKVRVVAAGEFSKELCGGTHVSNVGEIGLFKIVSETGVAAGIRRIEALTGRAAIKYMEEKQRLLKEACAALKCTEKDVLKKISTQGAEIKEKDKEIAELKSKLTSGALDDILNSAKDINGVKTIAYGLEGVDGNALRDLADKIRSKMGSGVVVLVSNLGDKVNLITMATKDVLDKGIHCGKIIKEVATIVGGGGGGRPDMAQAGGKKPENIPQAIEAAFQTVENLVK